MAQRSKIEWTQAVWNPTTGCTKISNGCKHCYAEKMAKRLQAMKVNGYDNGFKLSILEERIEQPLKRKSPTNYFVNSMSDLFHEEIPYDFITKVFDVMKKATWHNFQILTKRAERMADFLNTYETPHNVWLGVTVEDKEYGLPRIDILRHIKAHIRFISMEPLLEDLGEINLSGIHWVIVGGESGSNARPMSKEWVENIKIQCQHNSIPFFFKQWGTWGIDGKKRSKKRNGRYLDGGLFNEMPAQINS